MDQFGTVLDPFCLQIDWVNFAQILRLFEISNSNLNETAFRFHRQYLLKLLLLIESNKLNIRD